MNLVGLQSKLGIVVNMKLPLFDFLWRIKFDSGQAKARTLLS
jgi:hypothetical protein